MTDDSKRAERPPRAAISRRGVLLGLAALGGIAAANVGGFLYLGGWLTPGALTPWRFVDRFEQVFGKHDGFRRNHAKGLSASGYFTSNGAGTEVSKAVVFEPGRIPVTGRFSLSGGVPDAADANATIRGLGLLFSLPNGEQWRTAMVNIPVFLDSTPEGFSERLLASQVDPNTGQPDPEKMAAFLARHPETAAAMEIVRQTPPSSGFDNSTFHGLNAFRFTNSSGTTVPVRWMVAPEQPFEPAGPVQPPGRDYLFDALIRSVANTPLHWRLILTVGEPGDPTDDATKPWPDGRRTIDVGTLTIDSVQTEEPGNARDINFDPLILPDGIARSDDPLLSARSAVYARSFLRRSREPKQPSEVNVTEVLGER
ncbi:catalase family peroxidase [Rhodococcus xishaensis]|uniref:Catalase-related peroxidase n=1 Tax=Rhodococcus xishaensis TaxID=2487364 RepID=A0A3S3BKZ3_9NOCA|nr:catalase family peroxidase [Rhodococcus xishaensis]RVW03790.1 catalase family peroxidase [Rhodococcus xishaensis]